MQFLILVFTNSQGLGKTFACCCGMRNTTLYPCRRMELEAQHGVAAVLGVMLRSSLDTSITDHGPGCRHGTLQHWTSCLASAPHGWCMSIPRIVRLQVRNQGSFNMARWWPRKLRGILSTACAQPSVPWQPKTPDDLQTSPHHALAAIFVIIFPVASEVYKL